MRLGWLCLTLAVSLTACAPSLTDQWTKGETGTVVRIIDGDTLVLNGGQVVRLVSIEAPRTASRDRPEDPYGEQSRELLTQLALGREVQLYYSGLTEDRYERALAQVTLKTESGEMIWLNEEMVARGGAWVRIFPDTGAGSRGLWEAETTARQVGTGVWATLDPSDIDTVRTAEGAFHLLIAQLSDATFDEEQRECRYRLGDTGVTASYDSPTGECQTFDDEPRELRGWARNGMIYLNSPDNIRPVFNARAKISPE